jgi:hypothetical protein
MAIDAGLRFMVTATVALLGTLALSRFLPNTPVLRHAVQAPTFAGTGLGEAFPESEVLVKVGDRGRAQTDLRPVGKVSLDAAGDREFEARSAGVALDRGAEIVVVEVASGRIVVEQRESEGETA